MAAPLFLFAPGAGAPSISPWMEGWAARLEELGKVVRFDYPYMREGKRAPDRLPKLVEAHADALQRARKGHRGLVVLVGKSMGGRVGCHLATETAVNGLVCLGYPLKGASKRAPVRDAVLLELSTPVLFVQGDRDPMCPIAELESVRQRMAAPSQLAVVEGGNHSLQVTKTRLKQLAQTQDDIDRETLQAIARFVDTLR